MAAISAKWAMTTSFTYAGVLWRTRYIVRPSNAHGLILRLKIWHANSRSHGFASKIHGDSESLETTKKFQKVWRNIDKSFIHQGEESGTVRVKCLVEEHNTVPSQGSNLDCCLVCNHTNDKQNWMPTKQESNLLITSMITDWLDNSYVLFPIIMTIIIV